MGVYQLIDTPVDSYHYTTEQTITMKITSISFGLTKNLGNYESSRLDMSVEIQEGEDWEATLEELKALVNDKIGGVLKPKEPPKNTDDDFEF